MPTTDLHLRLWGDQGPPVLLLHGSTSHDGAIVWTDQRPLAAHYRLLVPDRRGYGASPGPAADTWEPHIADALTLLGTGAHLVGHSYGGVIGLLAAARRPDLIYSLTLIEPPAFGLARGNPVADDLAAALTVAFRSGLSAEAFSVAFARALGRTPEPEVTLSPQERAQTENIIREPLPWEAPIDLDLLAATAFPRLVVSGDWHPAFEAVADVLTTRLSATRAVLRGAGHGPHHVDEGRALDPYLRALFAASGMG
jgi:pimeloyl-ACP methyl ester carboxylesterase